MTEDQFNRLPEGTKQVLLAAGQQILAGHHVHFIYKCTACGDINSFDECNTVYETAECARCKAITNVFPDEANLGFMLVLEMPKEAPHSPDAVQEFLAHHYSKKES